MSIDAQSRLEYLLSGAGASARVRPGELAIKLTRISRQRRWQYSPRRLRADSVRLDRPIFLLGLPGNGATLVGRCLRRNPDVLTVSGNSDHWTGTDELGIVRSRIRRLPPQLRGNRFRDDVEQTLFGEWQLFACDELLPRYRGRAGDATPEEAEAFRRVLREHVAVYARDPRRARFLDKTHAYTVKASLLGSILEDARPFFVLVLRNPYGACPWTLRRKPPTLVRPLSDDDTLRLIVQHWANAYQAALEDAEHVPNFFALRFEDFLADPRGIVEALCRSLELEFDPTMVPGPEGRLPRPTLATDRKWHPLYPDDRLQGLTEREAEIVGAGCGRLAERFGYGPDGTVDGARGIACSFA